MTDNARKTSELPTANTIGNSDRLVFLYQANTSAPSTRTITANNFANSVSISRLRNGNATVSLANTGIISIPAGNTTAYIGDLENVGNGLDIYASANTSSWVSLTYGYSNDAANGMATGYAYLYKQDYAGSNNTIVFAIQLPMRNGDWDSWYFEDRILTLPSDGDIKNSDGFSVIKSIPQNLQSAASDYTLVPSDAGKHIYKNDGAGYSVLVPPYATVPEFEVGTVVTIVSGDSWTYICPADSGATEIWGAGYNQTSTSWYIPNNSMATLLKIGTDKWMLSGAGLAIDA